MKVSLQQASERYAAELVKVSKVYTWRGLEVRAMDDVDLTVQRGEFMSIVGPSGSGKSTLLNVLGTLDRPTEGQVFIDGVDTSGMDRQQLAKLRNGKIGFVFQSYNLINRITAINNIVLPALVRGTKRSEAEARALELMEYLGIGGLAERRPVELSGGQQQRVAITRALINEPSIVLADEPTGNLDSKSGNEIFNALKELSRQRGATVIVVTHNLELAMMTDRIVVLRDGRIEREERGGAN